MVKLMDLRTQHVYRPGCFTTCRVADARCLHDCYRRARGEPASLDLGEDDSPEFGMEHGVPACREQKGAPDGKPVAGQCLSAVAPGVVKQCWEVWFVLWWVSCVRVVCVWSALRWVLVLLYISEARRVGSSYAE